MKTGILYETCDRPGRPTEFFVIVPREPKDGAGDDWQYRDGTAEGAEAQARTDHPGIIFVLAV